MKDLTPIEAGRWLLAAPEDIQKFLTDDSTDQLIDSIATARHLPLEAADMLHKLIAYRLIGYCSPAEMDLQLRGAGVAEIQLQNLNEDLDRKIFSLFSKTDDLVTTVEKQVIEKEPEQPKASEPEQPTVKLAVKEEEEQQEAAPTWSPSSWFKRDTTAARNVFASASNSKGYQEVQSLMSLLQKHSAGTAGEAEGGEEDTEEHKSLSEDASTQ